MKATINKLILKVLQPYYKLTLKPYNGTHYISPLPEYISQFISIYPSSITTDTPLTNKKDIEQFGAKDSDEFTFWAWRDCGIVCIKMILNHFKKAKDKSIMDLTHEGIDLKGYLVNNENGKFIDKGWFHHSLVSLLEKYNISAKMKKWQTIESVTQDILNNKMVIISVHVPGRRFIKEDRSFEPKEHAKYGGHLLLAIGVKMEGKDIEGIFVHDPRGLENYQANTFISMKIFKTIFTNRTIVAN